MKSWKPQKFLTDLVYDLRSRNLLPVAIMLVVAMVAVPFLISRSASQDSGSVGLGAPASVSTSPEAQNAVVAYHPQGVRNLKQRLNSLGPKNPFIQQFAPSASKSPGDSTTLDGSVPSTGSIPGLGGSTGGGSGSGSTGGGSGSGGGKGGKGSSGGKTQTLYSSYQTDVTVSDGGAPASVANVRQFQFLPNDATPVLVYLGTSSAGTQALFLVSKDVTSVGGNGVCFPSADACQLLGVSAGAGADLLYGPDGKTYHVQVTRIRHVTSSQPPR